MGLAGDRGPVVGFLLGILPGGGATIASIASYVVEKRFARNWPLGL